MDIKELIEANRSKRRFKESERITPETLRGLVELGRCSASAGNLQPLKYVLTTKPDECAKIFECLSWAGYLTGWAGPEPGERPAAYITVLGDREITTNFWCDHGIAAQSIMLGAVAGGLGGCMIGSINRRALSEALGLTERYEVLLVLALGHAVEEVRIEEAGDGGIKYWRDEEQVHHVPKRPLDEIIL